MVGMACVLICLPVFMIDSLKSLGTDLVPPFGTICMIVTTVPTWGVFGYVHPFANYIVPAVVNSILSTLLCVRLLGHVRRTRHKLSNHLALSVIPRENRISIRSHEESGVLPSNASSAFKEESYRKPRSASREVKV